MNKVKEFFSMLNKIAKRLNIHVDDGIKLSHREDGYTTIYTVPNVEIGNWEVTKTFDTIIEFYAWLDGE